MDARYIHVRNDTMIVDQTVEVGENWLWVDIYKGRIQGIEVLGEDDDSVVLLALAEWVELEL